MSQFKHALVLASIALCGATGAVGAGEPQAVETRAEQLRFVAWIETIAAPNIRLRPLDLLPYGAVLQLSPNDQIVLGYFSSCVIDTISGGRVAIGLQESSVQGGLVQRRVVPCHRQHPSLPVGQQSAVGGLPVRMGELRSVNPEAAGPVVVHGRRPAFHVPATADELIIRSRSAQTKRWSFKIEKNAPIVDFAALGQTLEPGEYLAVAANTERSFRIVDDTAEAPMPFLSRLVWIGD